MDTEPIITIRRSGEELGGWDRFQIRQFISSGAIVPSDEFYDEEQQKWFPLVPSYRRKWNTFDWSDDDDRQWYYIKDGFIHGPRLIDEIGAMHDAGYLPDDTLVCFVAAEEWMTIAEIIAQDPEEPLEATAKDHANEAINAFRQGDNIGAGISGFKAIGKFFKNLTASEPITSEWLCVGLDGKGTPSAHSIIEHITNAGFSVMDHEFAGEGKDRKLCIRFSDIAEATRARDELECGEVAGGFLLLFSDRRP